MDPKLQTQIETSLSHLNELIRKGYEIRDALSANTVDASALSATRIWQQQCGMVINELSGGSKAHWLARSFSEAFLLRSSNGGAAEGASPQQIVERLTGVLQQAVVSLSQTDDAAILIASAEAPAPRRFGFVHNAELRPVLEQAYTESRRAFENGEYEHAMLTSCGVLEAIVTDALEHKGLQTLDRSGAPAGKIGDWPFQTRLAVAEKAGLVRGGWARLPAVALIYRDASEQGSVRSVSEREARLTQQVLHITLRDLDPGR